MRADGGRTLATLTFRRNKFRSLSLFSSAPDGIALSL
jgi:hypothetical protein